MYLLDRKIWTPYEFGDWLEKKGLDRGYPFYEDETYLIQGYDWDNDNEGEFDRPNFLHKPTGVAITWYKYPFRGAYINVDIKYKDFLNLLD